MQFFSDLAYQWTARQKQNLAQREPTYENDARTSNTRIVQRNRAMPHSTIKSMSVLQRPGTSNRQKYE